MKKLVFAAGSSFLLAIATTALADTDPLIGQHVPAFTAQVLDISAEAPKATPFDSATAKNVTTYIVLGTMCPASRAYAERMSQIQQLYGPKEVDFIFVYSNREDTLDSKIAFHREHKLGGRLIDDQGGAVAKKLGARKTSETFVSNKEGTVVYHGAIDDSKDAPAVKQRYLQMALDETLAGAPVKVTTSQVSA